MSPGLSATDLLRMLGSMALVLAAMAALLWALRRMQSKVGIRGGGRRLDLIETLSLNARHKLALVSVDGRAVLVGISPAQVTALAQWPAADATPSLTAGTEDDIGGTGRHA
jgi:flagellar biosynthetic protein FliO